MSNHPAFRVPILCLLLAFLTIGAGGARAQDAGDSAQLTIDFEGGPLVIYVELMREQLHEQFESMPLNVILRQDTSKLMVPPITLRNVSIETALRVAIPDLGHHTRRMPTGEVLDVWLELQVVQDNAASAPVYVVEERTEQKGPQFRGPDITQGIEVYSLEEAAAWEPGANPVISVDSMLTAIDAALALERGSGVNAEIKYHAESGLLIVRATSRQHHAIHAVLENLARNAGSRLRERQKLGGEIRQISDDIAVRRAEARSIETRLMLAHESTSELAAMFKAGSVSAGEFRAAEANQKILETELETAKILLNSLEERLDETQTRLRRSQGQTSMVSYDLKALGSAAKPVATMLRAIRSIAAQGPFDLTITDTEARVTATQGVHEQLERAISNLAKSRSGNRPSRSDQ